MYRPSNFAAETVTRLYHASVDLLGMMKFHRGNLSFLGQQLARSTGKGGVDLQTLDKRRGGDKLHLRHFGLKSVPAIFVEKNLSVQLFSKLSLVPLLLSTIITNGIYISSKIKMASFNIKI